MTKEEIIKEACKRHPILQGAQGYTNEEVNVWQFDGFVEGAEWMQKQMIEKMEEFLRKHTRTFRFGRGVTAVETDYLTNIDMIEELKKYLRK